MYSTTTFLKNSKRSGRLMGTHQKIDKMARRLLAKHLPKGTYFPSYQEIVRFEGNNGPDGLKNKSPGVDEPMHFILPSKDDGKLIKLIKNHQYNLRQALKKGDHTRASFEAAWLAHAVSDGLTPAHHFPLEQVASELMTEKEYVKLFGHKVKGIMHGRSLAETLRNNWLYWGGNGYMSKHIAFEFGIIITTAALPDRSLMPELTAKDFTNINLEKEFYRSLQRIAQLDMYTRFCQSGWTTDLAIETKEVLLPEIIRAVTLAWASALSPTKSTKPARQKGAQ